VFRESSANIATPDGNNSEHILEKRTDISYFLIKNKRHELSWCILCERMSFSSLY
jgi:hypothetical protein